MSGIAGVFNLDGSPLGHGEIENMTFAIRHRGPDDEGFLLVDTIRSRIMMAAGKDTQRAIFENSARKFPSVGICDVRSFAGNFDLALGHRRLSSDSPKVEVRQPLCSEDGQIWMVCDGSVFNDAEIRRVLEGSGHEFQSNDDLETIVHAYEEWGTGCFGRLNGQWAVAIWDGLTQTLICACDCFGTKPFYYFFNGRTFLFASEIKALLRHPLVTCSVNAETVHEYLFRGRTQGTYFSDIHELKASCYLVLGAGKRPETTVWWQPKVGPLMGERSGITRLDASREFREILDDSVRLRLSSGTTGITLSGGLDSTSVACSAHGLIRARGSCEVSGRKLLALSLKYDGELCDETGYCDAVADRISLTPVRITPDAEGLWMDLPEIMSHQDEPFHSLVYYAHWRLMREARSLGVRVIFSGDGGDELLAGYHWYFGVMILNLLLDGRIDEALRQYLALTRNLGGIAARSIVFETLSSALFRTMPIKAQRLALESLLRWKGRSVFNIVNKDFYDKYIDRNLPSYIRYDGSRCNLQARLLSDAFALTKALRNQDKNGAAFSIESRQPLLDRRLAEYAFALPASFKIHDGWTKWLLRESMKGEMPDVVRLRRAKQPFPTPIRLWLTKSKGQIRSLFESRQYLSGEYVNPRAVVCNLDRMLGSETGALELWHCVNLELWLKSLDDGRLRAG